MKIRIFSDLHLEFFDFNPAEVSADVVVLAGDIQNGHYGLGWARKTFPDTAIVYVMGNHEFYDDDLDAVLERAQREAIALEIHLLEKDQAIIDGVRFLGTTLWTDFEVEEPLLPRHRALRYANGAMADFSVIRYRGGTLRAETTREFHEVSRHWLADRLAEPFDGKTVVVTHHLPHRGSIARQFHRDPLNPAFASHLPELVQPPVNLWIHGHTHCSCDYEPAKGTRVLCNPRGYGPSELNARFDQRLTVEI
ncbi:MAG TPA: metallophosphoesterase [Steroidobacteraceae bacterium]|mgnify:FL=1|nr:metallophosphoesterase [Steroidobacteraceae bacterium]